MHAFFDALHIKNRSGESICLHKMRRTLLDVSGFCVSCGRLQLKKSCVRISCRQPYRAPPSETTFVEIQRQTGCQARSPPRSSKSGIHARKLWPADPSRHNRQSSRSLPPEPAGRCLQRERSSPDSGAGPH